MSSVGNNPVSKNSVGIGPVSTSPAMIASH